jgi:allophanate hydrolase
VTSTVQKGEHPAVAVVRAAHSATDPTQPIWTSLFKPAEVTQWAADADPDGPLAGLAFGVKDNVDVAGSATTAACPALADRIATTSATAVRRLVEAGAVPIGKTNLDQFATGLVGTRSPYGACHATTSVAHISGGSSSGSAIAVAAGLVPLAIATDTAGSGRVPAALNSVVGLKPTRGLVSTLGVLPACPDLDCVTTMTTTVAAARAALAVLARTDPADPWSRPRPAVRPPGIAARMRVVAVPAAPLDLDPPHAAAWHGAVDQLHRIAAHVLTVDISAFLSAGALLYGGAWLAARWAAFGEHLIQDSVDLDPVVRGIVLGGRQVTGAEVFADQRRLAQLRLATQNVWAGADALMLPVTPGHPRLVDVAADPVGVNTRLGTYTTFANLLDLCAVSVPAGRRPDGLPFGVQFLAPAFADEPLLDLAAAWCGELVDLPPAPTGTTLLGVVGAHLSGLPLNPQLVRAGGSLEFRARTAGGYRLYRLPSAGVPRPGLIRSGDGPPGGIEVEVWRMPHQGIGALLDTIPAPLGLGSVVLDDGSAVIGFLSEEYGIRDAQDITIAGGWRAASSY